MKTLQMLSIWIMFLVITLPMAAALEIKNIRIEDIRHNSTRVSWETDLDADAKVNYFEKQDPVVTAAENATITKLHNVFLRPLKPRTEYKFELLSSGAGSEARADNSGRMFDFITLEAPDLTAPEIKNIRIELPSNTTARITFATSEGAQATLYFGKTPELPQKIERRDLKTEHAFVIDAEPKVRTFFKIEACDQAKNCINSSLQQFVGGMDITPPTLEVNVPQFHNSNKLDVSGKTEPLSRIDLHVNSILSRSDEIGVDGSFNFREVVLRTGFNTLLISATDLPGNNFNQTFNVTVDKNVPRLTLQELPEVASAQQINVNGSVSKFVTVTITVSSTEDILPPAQVAGLRTDETGTNSVKLSWGESVEEDLLEYAVYRDNTRLTVTTDTQFIDAALDSGKTYSYQISAIDESCNEGRRSEGIIVTTQQGGQVINKPAENANFSCNTFKWQKSFPVNGSFIELVPLFEGINIIKVTVQDNAGNRAEDAKSVLFDQNPPKILDTNLNRISPTYIPDLTLRGKISEPAKIIVTVNKDKQFIANTEGPDNTFSVDIAVGRIVNKKGEHFSDRDENEVTGAPQMGLKVATTDEFPNEIEIVAMDRSGLNATETGTIVLTKCGAGSWWKADISEARPSILNPRLLLEGIAQVGMSVNLSWQGGFGNGTIRQDPKIRVVPMSQERESEYNLEFVQPPVGTWSRDRKQGYISINFNPMDLSDGQELTTFEKEELISEFNMDNCTVPGVGCIRMPLQIEIDFELSYPEGYFTRQYDRTIENEFVERLTQKQCMDLEVFIDRRVDPGVLPKGFLTAMVDMLSKIIDFIDQILSPLEMIQEIVFYSCAASIGIQFIMEVRREWNCGWGKLLKDLFSGSFRVEVAQTGLCKDVYTDDQQKQDACMSCQNALKKSRDFETLRNWLCDRIFCPSAPTFQRHVRDAKAGGAGYAPEMILFKDIGAESTTTFKGEPASGIALDTRSDCATTVSPVWGSGKGGKVYDIKYLWKEFGKDRPPLGIKMPLFSSVSKAAAGKTDCDELHPSDPDCCVAEYRRRWDSACLIMDEFQESACLAAQDANKLNEVSSVGLRCHRLWNAVAGFCEPNGKPMSDFVNTGMEYYVNKKFQGYYQLNGQGENFEILSVEGDSYTVRDPKGNIQTKTKGEKDILTPSSIRRQPAKNPLLPAKAFAVVFTPFIGQAAGVTAIPPEKVGAYQQYQQSQLYGSTSGGGFECLRGHRIKDGDDTQIYYRILPPANGDEQFYIHRGVVTRQANLAVSDSFMAGAVGTGMVPSGRSLDPNGDSPINAQLVFRPLSQNLAELFDVEQTTEALKNEREDKNIENPLPEEFDYKRAHPKFRNDLAQCLSPADSKGFDRFGVDPYSTEVADPIDRIYNEIRDKIGVTDKPYIVDPTSGLLRTVQCACLPGLIGYLKLYKNMADAVRNCFNTILVTGDGSAGVCQAVISVYVCDLIFDLIKCFSQKYSLGAKRSAGFGIGNVFGAITSAGTRTFSSVQNRYGTTNLFRALFVDRKLIHAICLFAFTGIWNLDVSGLLDQEAGIPIKSQGLLYPCERRFTSINPGSDPPGLVTWTYHFGAGLVAGAELSYRLELVCSAEPTCRAEDGFEKGQCDCQQGGRGKEAIVIRTGTLTKGQVLDTEGEIFEIVPNSMKRYDKAALVWEYRNNQGENVVDKQECNIKEEGGKPPINCKFDGTAFRCGVDFGGEEAVRFNTEPLPIYFANNNAYRLNDPMAFAYDIDMSIPDSAKASSSTNNKYTKFLGVRVFNHEGRKIYDSRDMAVDTSARFEEIYSDGRNTGQFNIKKLDSAMLGSGGGVSVSLKAGVKIDLDLDATNDPRNAQGNGKTNTYYIIAKDISGMKFYISKEYSLEIKNDPEKYPAKAHELTQKEFSADFRLDYTDPDDKTTIMINRIFRYIPKSGDVLQISYTNPADVATNLCGGKEAVQFTAEFGLYDGVNDHGAYTASTTVARDIQGTPQRRTVRFNVMCSTTGFTPGEQQRHQCLASGEAKKRCFCGSPEDFGKFLAAPTSSPNCGTEIQDGKGYCITKNTEYICSAIPLCDGDGTKPIGENLKCVCDVGEFDGETQTGGLCPENNNKYCYDKGDGKRACNKDKKVTSLPVIDKINVDGDDIAVKNGKFVTPIPQIEKNKFITVEWYLPDGPQDGELKTEISHRLNNECRDSGSLPSNRITATCTLSEEGTYPLKITVTDTFGNSFTVQSNDPVTVAAA